MSVSRRSILAMSAPARAQVVLARSLLPGA
jgi:hypothetical protein